MDPQIRVLVVDDDEPHAEAVAESLERVGYECVVAGTGREGLRLIEEQDFDIVLTDLIMDDVGGMDVLAKAKRELPTPRSSSSPATTPPRPPCWPCRPGPPLI